MLQLIYELRKNCCGRVDGTGGEIEGSTRGPRGPKNHDLTAPASKVLVARPLVTGDPPESRYTDNLVENHLTRGY